MTVRWQYALLALVLALFTWYLITGREKVETWVPMAVELINVPEGLMIQEGLVNKIEVRVRGPKGLVRGLDEKKLAYSLDASRLKTGENLIEFKQDKIPLSRAYEVMEIRPGRAILTVDRIVSRTVPVVPVWSAEESLAGNYRVESIAAAPDHVEITGPQAMVSQMEEVQARLMTSFEGEVPSSHVEEVPVLVPDEVEATPGLVEISLAIAPVTEVIPVKLTAFEVEPPSGLAADVLTEYVLLRIEGPRLLFATDEYRRDMAVVVRLGEDAGPGTVEADYWVKLPPLVRVVDREPETVKVKLTRN